METTEIPRTQARVTFGLFEADLRTGELWKAGYRVKLQGLPFRVLRVLLERAGEVVGREELQAAVWGPDVVVDFEHALSNAIKKVREALGDSADNPRFIETLSRRGFRFIAPVGGLSSSFHPGIHSAAAVADRVPAPEQDEPTQVASQTTTAPALPIPVSAAQQALPKQAFRRYLMAAGLLSAGALLGAAVLQWRTSHRLPATLPRIAQITQDGTVYSPKVLLLGTLSALATDGSHLFTPSNEGGHVVLSQISLSTGASRTLPLPSQIGTPEVEDISADGTQLLLRSNLAAASQQPLWIVPIDGGSAFRVSDVLAQSAAWMPDGRSVLYAAGNQISTVSLESGKSVPVASAPGRAFWPRWSPDGKTLRFTIIDSVNHTSSLWELPAGRTTPRPLLQGWTGAERECCGSWTADGREFIFEATRNGNTDLWKVDASLSSQPMRITNGPLNFKAPLPNRTGSDLFFVGQDIHSRLQRYDAAQKQYIPMQGFLAVAEHVTYSHDGKWVAWTDSTSRLWRARSDGTDRVLLTPSSMQVFMAAWAPDAGRLAFMARSPKQPWQIYTVRTDGGTPERLTTQDRNLGDPSFSPDGKSIVFGTIPELMGQDNTGSLGVMDLASHRVSRLPHSEGMYSPKWSPDGRYIVALTLAQKMLVLYDTASSTWKPLSTFPGDHPFWASDSRTVFLHTNAIDQKPIFRISVPSGKAEQIANLSNFHLGDDITSAEFSGVTPDDIPLMHAEISSGNLYTLDLKQPH